MESENRNNSTKQFMRLQSLFFQVREYKRLTELLVCDKALESLDKVEDGDCIVCFSKNDIFQVRTRRYCAYFVIRTTNDGYV